MKLSFGNLRSRKIPGEEAGPGRGASNSGWRYIGVREVGEWGRYLTEDKGITRWGYWEERGKKDGKKGEER